VSLYLVPRSHRKPVFSIIKTIILNRKRLFFKQYLCKPAIISANKGELQHEKNPDDRSDNVERIQKNISRTIGNMEIAEEIIAKTSDEKKKKDLQEKNDRRSDALGGMRKEIKDEAIDRERGYKKS